eukprot:5560864-Prymnesium_polylepis.1
MAATHVGPGPTQQRVLRANQAALHALRALRPRARALGSGVSPPHRRLRAYVSAAITPVVAAT